MINRMPAICFRGNVAYTEHGVAWAWWRLTPDETGTNSTEGKISSHRDHHALLKELTGEPVILGLATSADPGDIIERTLVGVDIEASPDAAAEAEYELEFLETRDLGARNFWLGIPLKQRHPLHRVNEVISSAQARIQATVGLPRWEPSRKAHRLNMTLVEALERRIPGNFHPAQAPAQDHRWITDHMARRGLYLDGPLPSLDQDMDRTYPGRVMVDPWLDETAKSDLTFSQRMNPVADTPFSRNYLKVAHPCGTVSYQVMQALTAAPKGGWEFPGIELLRLLGELPSDTDFAVRLSIQKGKDAMKSHRRDENNLKDQALQRDGDNGITGSAQEVNESAEELQGLNTSLRASDTEVEVKASVILASGGHTPTVAKEKADYVRTVFDGLEFTFESPLGAQEDLWWAMVPSTPRSRIVSEVEQVTSGNEFATALPISGSPLGYETGFLVGLNITLGRPNPFLLQIGEAMENDSSGSFAALGELGAGKSAFLKTAASHVYNRGGRLFGIDHSDNQEWAFFAQSLAAEDTALLDITDPIYTLDPLRNFPVDIAKTMLSTLFTRLWGVTRRSPEYSFLGLLLDPAYMKEHDISSLGALQEHLGQTEKGLPAGNQVAAQSLLGQMNSVSSTNYGRVLFDRSLPPLPLDRRVLIIGTSGMALPTQAELQNGQLYDELSLEKVFGRAMYALLAEIGRHVLFEDDSVEALMICDECHHMTSSPEGAEQIDHVLRYGRKHKAAVALGSHDAEDLGSETLRDLIPLRFVFRCRGLAIAKHNAAYLGAVPGTEEFDALVEKIQKDTSPYGAGDVVPEERRGECFVCDHRGRRGKLKILLPAHPDRRRTVTTTPPKKNSTTGPSKRSAREKSLA